MKTDKLLDEIRHLLVSYRDFFGVAVLLLMGVVLIFGGYISVKGIFGEHQNLNKAEKELEVLEDEVLAFETLKSKDLEAMTEVVDKALPSEKPVFDVLTLVSELASETGVSVSQLSSNPGELATGSARLDQQKNNSNKAKNAKEYSELQVTLEVDGSFQGLNEFILGLNELLPLIDLKEVRISLLGREEQQFSGEVDLSVYWMDLSDSQINTSKPSKVGSDMEEAYEKIVRYRVY